MAFPKTETCFQYKPISLVCQCSDWAILGRGVSCKDKIHAIHVAWLTSHGAAKRAWMNGMKTPQMAGETVAPCCAFWVSIRIQHPPRHT